MHGQKENEVKMLKCCFYIAIKPSIDIVMYAILKCPAHGIVAKCRIWGPCCDRNFLRFSPIFGEPIGVFITKQCYDPIFVLASSNLGKKWPHFRQIFYQKYF
jgi:hypothetical protein